MTKSSEPTNVTAGESSTKKRLHLVIIASMFGILLLLGVSIVMAWTKEASARARIDSLGNYVKKAVEEKMSVKGFCSTKQFVCDLKNFDPKSKNEVVWAKTTITGLIDTSPVRIKVLARNEKVAGATVMRFFMYPSRTTFGESFE